MIKYTRQGQIKFWFGEYFDNTFITAKSWCQMILLEIDFMLKNFVPESTHWFPVPSFENPSRIFLYHWYHCHVAYLYLSCSPVGLSDLSWCETMSHQSASDCHCVNLVGDRCQHVSVPHPVDVQGWTVVLVSVRWTEHITHVIRCHGVIRCEIPSLLPTGCTKIGLFIVGITNITSGHTVVSHRVSQ